MKNSIRIYIILVFYIYSILLLFNKKFTKTKKNQGATTQKKPHHDQFWIYFPLHGNIYIYILYLQSMWQQIKSDIHVKFILIKLYKNGLQWQNTATPQIFILEVRKMDGKYGKRGTPRALHVVVTWAFVSYAVSAVHKKQKFSRSKQ